jgi:hypothetical protein
MVLVIDVGVGGGESIGVGSGVGIGIGIGTNRRCCAKDPSLYEGVWNIGWASFSILFFSCRGDGALSSTSQ